MNNNPQLPIFVGPYAELAAYQWTKHYIASRLLDGIEDLSLQLLGNISNASEPLEIIKTIKKYGDSVTSTQPNETEYLLNFLIDIPGIGKKSAQKVIRKYRTISVLLNVSVNDLAKISKISVKRAQLIKDHLSVVFR